MKLNSNQLAFCEFYVNSLNARHSAIKAGYKKTNAHITGYKLLQNKKVQNEIKRLNQIKRSIERHLSKDDIINKYIDIAFADLTDYVEIKKENNRTYITLEESKNIDGSLVQEISQGKDGTKIKLLDKMKALEWLACHLGIDKMKEHRINIDLERIEMEKQRIKHEIESDDNIQENIKAFLEATKSSKEELDELFEDDISGDTAD